MTRKIFISDPTLRDGNHAVGHQITADQVEAYAAAADATGVAVIEVGHGNGLGASSLQVGESLLSDAEMISIARKHIHRSKLGVFCLPSFATINKDLRPAVDLGADVIRVGSHCTEADVTQRHMEFARSQGKDVYGSLMMIHMATVEQLAVECKKMASYGAQGVILMDSVGGLLPVDVKRMVEWIVPRLSIPLGFHAHNNLGMAVANSIMAIEAGASICDGTARGFGAGAGNTPIEILVAVLQKLGYETGMDLYSTLDASDVAERTLLRTYPKISPLSIVSGLAGVFSGFAKHVERVSVQYGVDPRDVFFELGRKKVVAGQEDMIIEVAMSLLGKKRHGLEAKIC